MRIPFTATGLALAVLLAGPVLAQPLAQSPVPAEGAPAAAGAPAPVQFVTVQPPSQWRGSKIVGVTVYGADDQRLGEISELLVDDSGQVGAVVIGLGGFLGIGEKSVAVPFSAIQWRVPAVPSAALPANAATGLPAGRPAGSGANPPEANPAGTGLPSHPVLNVSKEELNQAPSFLYAGRSPGAPKAPGDAGEASVPANPGPAKIGPATTGPANTAAPNAMPASPAPAK